MCTGGPSPTVGEPAAIQSYWLALCGRALELGHLSFSPGVYGWAATHDPYILLPFFRRLDAVYAPFVQMINEVRFVSVPPDCAVC